MKITIEDISKETADIVIRVQSQPVQGIEKEELLQVVSDASDEFLNRLQKFQDSRFPLTCSDENLQAEKLCCPE
jgi:hypothetical protein